MTPSSLYSTPYCPQADVVRSTKFSADQFPGDI